MMRLLRKYLDLLLLRRMDATDSREPLVILGQGAAARHYHEGITK